MSQFACARKLLSLLFIFMLTLMLVAATPSRHAEIRPLIITVTFEQSDEDEKGVTFDNLLAADSYALYIEARNIGEQFRPGGLVDIFEPILPSFSQMSNEIFAIARLASEQAETLSRARLMIASSPAKPSLPEGLFVIELASSDAAERFEPALQSFFKSLLSSSIAAHSESAAQQTALPFFIKRVGRLVVFSPKAIALKSLRAEDEKPMNEDAKFRAARDRFYSETVFIYHDKALSEQITRQRRESSTPPAELKHENTAPSSSRPPDSSESAAPVESVTAVVGGSPAQSQAKPPRSGKTKRAKPAKQSPEAIESPALAQPGSFSAEPAISDADSEQARRHEFGLSSIFWSIVMGGREVAGIKEDATEAIAIAISLESDSLVVRAMFINATGAAASPTPFSPFAVSGPAQVFEAASYIPAQTDIFFSGSIDLLHLYDSILNNTREAVKQTGERAAKSAVQLEADIAAFEKKHKFRVRDDLLAMLGNEIALAAPSNYLPEIFFGMTAQHSQKPQSKPILLISVRNKEAVQSKLAPVFEALGLKQPKEKGLTEKRGDIEIKSYARVSFAFVNNFLIIGSDAATINRVIEARLKETTLATARDFFNYTRWQPREAFAHAYISSAVLNNLFKSIGGLTEPMDEETKSFLARYSFEAEPVTYAASPDAGGPMYELRIPKNLIVSALARIAAEERRSRLPRNEEGIRSLLFMLNEHLKEYREEKGRYGTLEEIRKEKKVFEMVFNDRIFERTGYKVEITLSGSVYVVTATPVEYGKTGRLSFYTDQSGVLREGDHGGRPATASDKPSKKTY